MVTKAKVFIDHTTCYISLQIGSFVLVGKEANVNPDHFLKQFFKNFVEYIWVIYAIIPQLLPHSFRKSPALCPCFVSSHQVPFAMPIYTVYETISGCG